MHLRRRVPMLAAVVSLFATVASAASKLERASNADPRACTTGRRARAARRRQRHVADGLCYIARSVGPRTRRRRNELLLVSRAAAVRVALLQVAALVRCSTNPDPECITELHTLLTSGCDSPLYNPDVPAEQLTATLERAHTMLATNASASVSAAITAAPKAILAAVPAALRVATVCAAVTLVAAGVVASKAAGAAATSAQYSATVPFAVSSITVSPQNGTFAECTGGSGGTATTLALPNGTCRTSVTVTEGGGSAYVYAAASDATAADGGKGWSLCVPSTKSDTPSCSNSDNAGVPGGGMLPGADQFALQATFSNATTWLGSTNTCLAPGSSPTSCASLAGSSAPVNLKLFGPSQSTDDAISFRVGITFTVVPG
jgi:hypothetical protein